MTDNIEQKAREKMTSSLLQRLKGATEGSRELDAAIYELVGDRQSRAFWNWRGMQSKGGSPEELWRQFCAERAPAYTSSLDAAMQLVPEGAWWSVQSLPNPHVTRPACSASITTSETHEFASAWTAPLALVITALSARFPPTPAD